MAIQNKKSFQSGVSDPLISIDKWMILNQNETDSGSFIDE